MLWGTQWIQRERRWRGGWGGGGIINHIREVSAMTDPGQRDKSYDDWTENERGDEGDIKEPGRQREPKEGQPGRDDRGGQGDRSDVGGGKGGSGGSTGTPSSR